MIMVSRRSIRIYSNAGFWSNLLAYIIVLSYYYVIFGINSVVVALFKHRGSEMGLSEGLGRKISEFLFLDCFVAHVTLLYTETHLIQTHGTSI